MFVKHKSRPAAKALDIFPSGWYILSVFGEMSERFKEPVLKTGDGATHRGFESHSLRHNTAHCVCSGLYFFDLVLAGGGDCGQDVRGQGNDSGLARSGKFVPCSYLQRMFEFC